MPYSQETCEPGVCEVTVLQHTHYNITWCNAPDQEIFHPQEDYFSDRNRRLNKEEQQKFLSKSPQQYHIQRGEKKVITNDNIPLFIIKTSPWTKQIPRIKKKARKAYM